MIPQIITISEGDLIETYISQFANQQSINSSQIIVVKPEDTELTVDQIHILQSDIKFSFSKKVLVVLIGVDSSSVEVQNSLLKSLEEDSERIQFLFLVYNYTKLLPTILSRCSVVNQTLTSHISQTFNKPEEIFSFQSNSDSTKEQAIAKIDTYIENIKLKNHHTLSHLLTIRRLIMDNNMNPVLALDNILIFLSKQSTMEVPHEK